MVQNKKQRNKINIKFYISLPANHLWRPEAAKTKNTHRNESLKLINN